MVLQLVRMKSVSLDVGGKGLPAVVRVSKVVDRKKKKKKMV